jgi:hypothetical protein
VEDDRAVDNIFCTACGAVGGGCLIVDEIEFGETSSGATMIQWIYFAQGASKWFFYLLCCVMLVRGSFLSTALASSMQASGPHEALVLLRNPQEQSETYFSCSQFALEEVLTDRLNSTHEVNWRIWKWRQ